ncbi:hypothetical protein ACWKWF_13360 [Acinetobacter kookii]
MPEFHTELQHLTQQQLQLLQQENQALKSSLQMMKDEIKEANNIIALQKIYQDKLQQLIEQLNSELQHKDQQIQQYQNYLSSNIDVPDQTNLSNILVPLFKESLNTYLQSEQFQMQWQKYIEAKLSSYSSCLETLNSINWASLQYPEKSVEKELDNVLSEVMSMSNDLSKLINLYQPR